jgi:SAM-dependent methyltransferase
MLPMNIFDKSYAAARLRNPAITYSEVIFSVMHRRQSEGERNFKLTRNHTLEPEWQTTGMQTFQRLFRFAPITPETRVLEYACGNLRVAYNFIKFLKPERFVGLDMIDDFMQVGRKLLGPETLAEKKPQLLVINDENIAKAAEFQADFIYVTVYSCHIHPDEADRFYENLRRICAKPAAKLILSAYVADKDFETGAATWVHPLAYYTDRLEGMELRGVYPSATRDTPDGEYKISYLEFVRI